MGKAVLWILAVGLVLAPVSAQSQPVGEITSITITPSPAPPGQTVSITVNIVGLPCLATLDFGDKSSSFVSASQTITHVYNQSGAFSLTASPAPLLSCSGSATATLPVLSLPPGTSSMNCVIFGCNPIISSMPFSQVRPGGIVLFVGTGFGMIPGTASMALQTANGDEQWIPVQIPDGWWTPTWVSGYIPPSPLPQQSQEILSNFLPQTASFQIVTSDQAGSNAFQLPFSPALDIQDIDSLWITCSMTANSPSDACQWLGNDNWPTECGWGGALWAPPTVGFGAYHGSGWQIFAGANDTGTDTFSFVGPLGNGWQTSGYSFNVETWSGSGSSWAEFLNYPTPGETSNPPNWSVLWNVGACDWVIYTGDYWITGPLGTKPY